MSPAVAGNLGGGPAHTWRTWLTRHSMMHPSRRRCSILMHAVDVIG
jgi:hypothetical protein